MCLSADQFAGNDLVSSGAVVKRSRLDEWNFDGGVDTGKLGPRRESRRDEEMPSATVQREIPTARPPEPDSQASEP